MTNTIGQRLKAEREEQRLTLEKVFEATRIRVQYLQALGQMIFLSCLRLCGRGYLRNYAEFLVDVDRITDELGVSAQPTSGEVIGPADQTPSVPPLVTESIDTVPVIATPDVSEVLQAESVPIEEVPVPIKPKPVRRKKADSDSQPASVEPPTKRRGRKKMESISAPVVAARSEVVEETIAPVASVPEPEHVEESVAPPESVPETVVEEAPQQSEVSDTASALWQAWLNRLGSVCADETAPTGIAVEKPAIIAAEPDPEVPTEVGIHNRPFENSNEIFKEIGRELRTRRELLSLHFDEVERNTHVKAHYLDALERGALDELPSTVQTRGMLSNYATFLDLDVDALLLRFADALQARHRERNPQKSTRTPGQPIIPNMPPVRGFIAGDLIFGVSVAILLVGFAIWGVSRVMTIQSQREVKPTAPSISDVLLASPDPAFSTATATFLPVESFPGEATVTVEIPTQNVNAQVQLNLVAVERTYMRVIVDGEVAFDGRVVPGNAYPFEAENQIEVLVGSGAAIRTVYNGRDLGLMGTFGQVINNIYLGTEIITPTALPSPSPTITSRRRSHLRPQRRQDLQPPLRHPQRLCHKIFAQAAISGVLSR
jgi:cytoskeletal protein RodZ